MDRQKNFRKEISLWRIALSLKWILALVAALSVAGAFIMLSGWQWGRSGREDPAKKAHVARTLDAVTALPEVIRPGEHVSSNKADRMVKTYGAYEKQQAVVEKRLQDGEDGYWIVSAFRTAGQEILPVVRAWVRGLEEIPPAPPGRQEITGRLIPTETPESYPDDQEHYTLVGGERVPLVRTLSTAELINLWLPFENGDDTYAAAVASDTISVEARSAAAEGVKAVSLVPKQEVSFNWLNVFYALEWSVFAGFSLFLWWRLVRDDYERRRGDFAQIPSESIG